MEIDFQKLMANKSDEGLLEYLENRTKFTPEAIEAAIAEMQTRGRVFEEEELSAYRREFEQRREITEKEDNEFWKPRNSWNKNMVTDETAPAFYSQRAIFLLTVLFSTVFGSIILALNFRKTESKKGVSTVIAFGILYTAVQIWILNFIPRNSGLALIFGIGGAFLLNQIFWKKYIGNDTRYRSKPIWLPLMIGIVISVPFLLAILYSGANASR